MKRFRARRPSPALVIACIALFVSLSGVSYGVATGFIDSREIKNNTIRTQDLRNNEVRTGDIRNSTVRGRDVAVDTLTGDDINESTLRAVPAKQEAVHKPNLPAGFTTVAGRLVPGYWKDTVGVVHLEGSIRVTNAGTAIVLPRGYAPAATVEFQHVVEVPGADPTFVAITVDTAGNVEIDKPAELPLDGITFRAAG